MTCTSHVPGTGQEAAGVPVGFMPTHRHVGLHIWPERRPIQQLDSQRHTGLLEVGDQCISLEVTVLVPAPHVEAATSGVHACGTSVWTLNSPNKTRRCT
jgi:hypothetical protein